MSSAITHFGRTIELGNLVGIDFSTSINLKKHIDSQDVKSVSKQIKKCIKLYKGEHLKKIKEIYAIEKEKLKLHDSQQEIKNIFKKEVFYTKEREKLLSYTFIELFEVSLHINPLVQIYESDWEWSEKEPFERLFDLKKVLTIKKADHYFLFEKTGTFDAILDSNILESPLSVYEYFLLQLFEETKIVKNVVSDFIQIFEITNVQEEKEFFILVEKILRELIFRRFIIGANSDYNLKNFKRS